MTGHLGPADHKHPRPGRCVYQCGRSCGHPCGHPCGDACADECGREHAGGSRSGLNWRRRRDEPGPTGDGSERDAEPGTNGSGQRDRLSVWTSAQRDARGQRAGRYVPESVQHPARMLPAIAAQAITAYTQPGEFVLDPMCGIGTTLVESIHAGRHAFGVEYESRWTAIARRNIALARRSAPPPVRGGEGPNIGTPTTAMVRTGDATRLPTLVPANLHGRFALVLTSPPYGPSTHGQITVRPGRIEKRLHSYGADRGDRTNLAHRNLAGLLEGFTMILRGCADLLRPGGAVVITARPYRHKGELVDLPGAVINAGRAAGLVPVERCVALLAGVRDGRIIARGSFFQYQNIRAANANGVPLHLIVHEDVIVMRKPPSITAAQASAPHVLPLRGTARPHDTTDDSRTPVHPAASASNTSAWGRRWAA